MKTHTAPKQQPRPFELGESRSHAGLTIVPLFPLAEPRLEYVGLDEAVARGLTVSEVDEHGAVQTLLVRNPLDEHVLLYEGEELVGAKQNRIVAWSTLVAAALDARLEVHCVEQNRWSRPAVPFTPAPRAAYTELRRAKLAGGQQAVWASVAAKSSRMHAFSPTAAAEAIYVSRAGSLDEYAVALPRRDGQSGALVAIGGEVVCLDYVSRSDVFAGLYAKLLRGYALDALERPVDRPLRRGAVAAFLDSMGDRRGALYHSPGIGSATRFGGAVAGQELVAEGEIVALNALATG
jgi:hypothetical protein